MGKVFAGIDVGGTDIKFILCDADFSVLADLTVPTDVPISPTGLIAKIIGGVNCLLQNAAAVQSQLCGICIALPGLVDYRRNIPVKLGALKWENTDMDLVKLLRRQTEVPVYLMNDGNAHLLGEHHFGKAKAHEDVVLLSLGTGVGGAVMTQGRLLTGTDGFAGELGHMIIEADGAACNCGNYGCFQAYCSARAIIKYAKESMAGRDTVLWEMTGGAAANLRVSMITDGALRKDRLCQEIMNRTGKYLGIGIASLIQIFNPSLIMIGGGISNAGELLLGTAQKHAFGLLLHDRQRCLIEKTEFASMAAARGACVWGLGKLRE